MIGYSLIILICTWFVAWIIGSLADDGNYRPIGPLYALGVIFCIGYLIIIGAFDISIYCGIIGLCVGYDYYRVYKHSPFLYYLASFLIFTLISILLFIKIDFKYEIFDWRLFIYAFFVMLAWWIPVLIATSFIIEWIAKTDENDKTWLMLIFIGYLLIANVYAVRQYNDLDNKENNVALVKSPTEEVQLDCSKAKHYCTQMVSCSEAKLAYQCGNHNLDRDNDGIPCDNLCQ